MHSSKAVQGQLSTSASRAPQTKQAVQPDSSATAATDTWGLSSEDWGVSAGEPGENDIMDLNAALEELSVQPVHPAQVSLCGIACQ